VLLPPATAAQHRSRQGYPPRAPPRRLWFKNSSPPPSIPSFLDSARAPPPLASPADGEGQRPHSRSISLEIFGCRPCVTSPLPFPVQEVTTLIATARGPVSPGPPPPRAAKRSHRPLLLLVVASTHCLTTGGVGAAEPPLWLSPWPAHRVRAVEPGKRI
jgi:hypothetical protein